MAYYRFAKHTSLTAEEVSNIDSLRKGFKMRRDVSCTKVIFTSDSKLAVNTSEPSRRCKPIVKNPTYAMHCSSMDCREMNKAADWIAKQGLL
ncbi:hypothetical protein AQUCO_02800136v1 [Aquilegia coerulea]|uniref:Uncharacterized protein n=1 Tax=Aquilegia coerulea TaxID=218851 RepID=A0A2G5D402_AQUCA|nr:hypothetical protein AQUCO_02800136v1 [Aquilegia coerulea]